MAASLTPEALAQRMDLASMELGVLGSMLLVDCRPFLAYNSGHINTAHNVHCPPIVKRRAGGSLTLDNVIRCVKTRSAFLAGEFDCVVVYDDCSLRTGDLPTDSNMYLVIKSLREDPHINQLYFLVGGYRGMESACPALCTGVTGDDRGGMLPTLCITHSEDAIPISDHSTSRYCPSKDQGLPVRLFPWLYIGSVQHAGNGSQLSQLGVTAMLNVSRTVSPTAHSGPFRYHSIPVDDDHAADISRWFPDAIEFIDSVRREGGIVLVHCQAGVSRSATICLAYLMQHQDCSLEQAYDQLKARRSFISPNLNFMQQLLAFESQLGALRSKPKRNKVDALCRSPLRNSISMPTELFSHSVLRDHELAEACTAALKPSLSLPLTPCTQQAFVFDSPLTPQSPLLSPS